MTALFTDVHKWLATWPDAALSIALLVAAGLLILLAIQPGHDILKAIALAYVVFP